MHIFYKDLKAYLLECPYDNQQMLLTPLVSNQNANAVIDNRRVQINPPIKTIIIDRVMTIGNNSNRFAELGNSNAILDLKQVIEPYHPGLAFTQFADQQLARFHENFQKALTTVAFKKEINQISQDQNYKDLSRLNN